MKLPDASVPPLTTRNLPDEITNVSVLTTADGNAVNVIVLVPHGFPYTDVIVDSLPAFAPVKNLIILSLARPLI